MQTATTQYEAKELYDRIRNSDCNIAVFVRNRIVRTCKTKTDLFRKSIHKYPKELMGIYDSNIHQQWLADDLEVMGVV